MQYRALGGTGIEVSFLCLGVLTIGPLQENLPIDRGAEVISYALEKGISFLDTAECYGTYPHIKEALKSVKCRPVITSKSYAYTAQGMHESLEKALDEMEVDFVDIFLLHEQEDSRTIEGHSGALEYLMEARRKGRVRAVGISTHSVAGVMAGADDPRIEVIHPLINQAGIGIMDGSPQTMGAAIQYARLRGKGLYAMKALAGGNLIGDAFSAFHYVRAIPGLSSVAVGMKSRDEIDLNLTWFEGLRDQELESRVAKTPRRLLIEEWCEGCGLCAVACRHQALEVIETRAVVNQGMCSLCGYCAAYCPNFCIKVL